MPAFGKKKHDESHLHNRTLTYSDTSGGIEPMANKILDSDTCHVPATGDSPSAATHQAIETMSSPSSGTNSVSLKSVPRDYFDCPMPDLTVLVSSMLQELVSINDGLPFNPDELTRFHSRSAPNITVHDYLVRIIRFCSLEKSILITVIYFIDLLCKTYPTFNINSLTVHRFIITAAMVGSKGLCDSFCTNSHYAKVGGLSKVELNLLEVEFLTRVDYRIVPQGSILGSYYERMVYRLQDQYSFLPIELAKKKTSDVIKGALSISRFFSSSGNSSKAGYNKSSGFKRRSQVPEIAAPSSLTNTTTQSTTDSEQPVENEHSEIMGTPKKLKPSI